MNEQLLTEFSKSREGARLLAFAEKQGIDIEIDRQLQPNSAAAFMPGHNKIMLPVYDSIEKSIVILAHELRHVQQYTAGLFPGPALPRINDAGHPEIPLVNPVRSMILLRMAEADAAAFQTLFARNHSRETGNAGVAVAALGWSFARETKPHKPAALQMLNIAQSFLQADVYWKHYKGIYLDQLEGLYDLYKSLPDTVALKADSRPGVTISDIRKFSELETSMTGVGNYLKDINDRALIAQGFLSLPSLPDAGIRRVVDTYEKLTAKIQNPKKFRGPAL